MAFPLKCSCRNNAQNTTVSCVQIHDLHIKIKIKLCRQLVKLNHEFNHIQEAPNTKREQHVQDVAEQFELKIKERKKISVHILEVHGEHLRRVSKACHKNRYCLLYVCIDLLPNQSNVG